MAPPTPPAPVVLGQGIDPESMHTYRLVMNPSHGVAADDREAGEDAEPVYLAQVSVEVRDERDAMGQYTWHRVTDPMTFTKIALALYNGWLLTYRLKGV